MPVGLNDCPHPVPIEGVRLASVCAGIKKNDKLDLVVIELSENSQCSAVFTTNAFRAAPVQVAESHLKETTPRYLLINSGNANAGTGLSGYRDAQSVCQSLAHLANCEINQVLPFSTGVIGERLPMNKIKTGMNKAYPGLAATMSAWQEAAAGIMTTDTIAKACSYTAEIDGKTVTVTGIVKGSGMIRPNMATMLSFIFTDVEMSKSLLHECLLSAVNDSFHNITVDGDTSTNDACVLVATGASGVHIVKGEDSSYEALRTAVGKVCTWLAQAIIRDAEGISKFITVSVDGAQDIDEARTVAFSVAHSTLVKTAFFASDPNWGRILAAIGHSGVSDLDINKVRMFLDDICVVENGGVAQSYREQQGQAVMDQAEITVRILLGRGNAFVNVWTSDLSHDYVTINSDYRT